MDLLTWLDANPARHWGLCGFLVALLVAAAFSVDVRWAEAGTIGGRVGRVLRHPASFLGLGALALLAFRWPILYFPRLLDHDEAQMGAQAIKYFTDIVPWRSVDGTTSGPLNSWWLMIPRLLGGEINWLTIRLMGLVCVFGTFACTWGTVRRLGSETLARVAALVLLCFYLFAHGIAVLHYTSEHFPILLLSGAAYFAVRARHAERLDPRWLVPAAALCGAVPFAKLQPSPLGALGGVLLLVILMEKTRGDRSARMRGIAWWAAAGAAVPALILGMVAAGGALRDFWISYPGQLRTFKEIGHPGAPVTELLRGDQQSSALVTAGVLAGGVLLWLVLRGRGRGFFRAGEPFCWAAAYLAVALFCVLWSGQNYPHYFLFLVHPIVLCLATLAAALEGLREDGDGVHAPLPDALRGFGSRLPWVALAPVLVMQLAQFVDQVPFCWYVGQHRENLEAPKEHVVQAIEKVARPGDRLTVWGMTPSYHVDSGLPPGTRDAIAQMQILASSRQAYYRDRFLADFMKSRPRLFIDTDTPYLMMTGGSFVNYVKLPQHGHEVFPELAAIIRTEYREVYSSPIPIENTDYRVRVYLRKE